MKMKHPFKEENYELIFRKEKFQYIHLCYVCEDTQERFITQEIGEVNLFQVYNQYRIKYGIPFPDETKQAEELAILETVANKFRDVSASEISELSHNENAWTKYYTTNQMIDYNEAFSLRAFEE